VHIAFDNSKSFMRTKMSGNSHIFQSSQNDSCPISCHSTSMHTHSKESVYQKAVQCSGYITVFLYLLLVLVLELYFSTIFKYWYWYLYLSLMYWYWYWLVEYLTQDGYISFLTASTVFTEKRFPTDAHSQTSQTT